MLYSVLALQVIQTDRQHCHGMDGYRSLTATTVAHNFVGVAQVLAKLTALPAGHQLGDHPPHNHWLYWPRLQADDFPATAISSSHQQQQAVLPGACDINSVVRSLAQQLSDAVPGAFSGPVGRPAVAGAADSPENQASHQQQQQRQQQQRQDMQAAADSIIDRVRAHSSKHAAWVQELLGHINQPDWRQHQQTYLRLVSCAGGKAGSGAPWWGYRSSAQIQPGS
jgi:hypothetical protein